MKNLKSIANIGEEIVELEKLTWEARRLQASNQKGEKEWRAGGEDGWD